jgi:rRNA maturation endonuclease Nob1
MARRKYKRCEVCGKQLDLEDEDICHQCQYMMMYCREIYKNERDE